ncbi:hypothetical protein G6F70_003896 [Rhizopus microsporus]|uniref:Putative isomerase YbhE n=2 Tax=Rhizopus TaxID=4842 RepID=A0A0A1NLW7_RHIZD|nr:hypothetical protein G6F71_003853 [Rhizopus microsporus]KAG1200613.1 hypothetical protein G6F70_003896 [Rhizopus microsporus]KAG1212390.1 hypothetical protein G6F69_003741 [Rhizopus microsporus]KAG1234110.1 hypothetical protein G6F67_003785 [Rhizopus microsporus]KAG1266289.1 hypothetical protein G6F68_002873 [Rhizopus microsporus]
MSQVPVYVSGYTNEKSTGIYLYAFDTTTGTLSLETLAAESANPSWFCFHKSGQHLYATNEVASFNNANTGYISAYNRDPQTGKLTLANQQVTNGQHPCHAACDSIGNFLVAANYTGGSVSVFPINAPGSPESNLGDVISFSDHNQHYNHTMSVPTRQEKAHCHSVDFDPIADRYIFVNDLGCDLLVTYLFDKQSGSISPHSTFSFPPGTGPRHLKFAPNHNNFCYVVGELSNDVFMLEFDFEGGKFNEIQRVHALPQDFEGDNLGAEIDISPNGKFLYVSMRGYDAITIFEINEWTGKLSLVGYQPTGGKHPRHFTIDPTGQFLLVGNTDSDNIVVFKIDQATGLLEQVSSVEHVKPTCIRFWT